MEVFEYIVDSEVEDMRMDRYLKKICKNEPSSRIFKALKNGDVRINSKKIKENYRLSLNDIITIKYLNVDIEKKDQENINFDINKYKKIIIFENEDFFIVNKPEKVPMHKGTGHEYGISEIYKKLFENENINFANRIDFETSGLVIGCKTKKYLRYISKKIKDNQVSKKYIAIVHGEVKKEEFSIENFLLVTDNGVKISNSKSEKAKKAITNFRKIENINLKLQNIKHTILDINLITGRKHQIRVQLSNEGYPIIGDKKYGIKDNSEKFYLCCYEIAFDSYKFNIKYKIFK